MRILDVDEARPSEAAGLTPHLVAGEAVHAAFISPTGFVLFTARRILIVQRDNLLEEQVETTSFPNRAVRHFSIREAPGGSSRSAIRIWLGDDPQPLHLRANPGTDFATLQALLVGQPGSL